MRQITGYYLERIKRNFFVSCLSALIGIPCLGAVFCGIFSLGLPAIEKADSQFAPYVLAVAGLVGVIFLLGVLVVIAGITIVRRSRMLDAVFIPLGLAGSSYMLYGRQYHGQIKGRPLSVYISRGPNIDIRIGTSVQTRVQIFLKESIPVSVANAFNKNPVPLNNSALDQFSVFSVDEAWTQDLLIVRDAVEAVRVLMTVGANWALFRQVEIQPGEVILNLNRSKNWLSSPIVYQEVQAWVESLFALAGCAESQPAPRITAAPTGVTRASREKTSNFLWWAVAAVIIGVPLCTIGAGVIAYLFITIK